MNGTNNSLVINEYVNQGVLDSGFTSPIVSVYPTKLYKNICVYIVDYLATRKTS